MFTAPFTRRLTVAVLFVALAACSTVRIAYYGADFFIHQYADDYLGLDQDLLTTWKPHLNTALARHKAEELPYLARFFDNALKGVEQGFDQAKVGCLQDQLLAIYRRHAELAIDLAVPLLAASGPAQVDTLEARFREDWEEEADTDPQAVARREQKRAKRYAEAIQWWIGGLTPPQEARVASAAAAMPDTAPAWDAYRNSRQQGLVQLLRKGADERALRSYLTAWLVDFKDMPDRLSAARHAIRDVMGTLVVDFTKSFDPQQKQRLEQRLRGLRGDFLALQSDPQLVGTVCN